MKKLSLEIHIPLKFLMILMILILTALGVYGYLNLQKITNFSETSPIGIDYLLPEINIEGYDKLKKIP